MFHVEQLPIQVGPSAIRATIHQAMTVGFDQHQGQGSCKFTDSTRVATVDPTTPIFATALEPEARAVVTAHHHLQSRLIVLNYSFKPSRSERAPARQDMYGFENAGLSGPVVAVKPVDARCRGEFAWLEITNPTDRQMAQGQGRPALTRANQEPGLAAQLPIQAPQRFAADRRKAARIRVIIAAGPVTTDPGYSLSGITT